MALYSVGDVVKIRPKAKKILTDTFCPGWNSSMESELGQVKIVKAVTDDGFYYIGSGEGSQHWHYTEDCLESADKAPLYSTYHTPFTMPYSFGYTASYSAMFEPKKSLITKTMSIIKNLAKSKERKALEEFNLLNEDGSLNERGRSEFVTFLFEGTAKAEFEAKIAEAHEARKKECKE